MGNEDGERRERERREERKRNRYREEDTPPLNRKDQTVRQVIRGSKLEGM
jgi:hypothetical protein